MGTYEGLRVFIIDAFTAEPMRGNAAAVCPLVDWPGDHVLEALAAEFNLSETAFFCARAPAGGAAEEGRQGAQYHLRWFSPRGEVGLCGHATLGAAWCLFNELGHRGPSLGFMTRAGLLRVREEGGLIVMDFPSDPPVQAPLPEVLGLAFEGTEVLEYWRATDHVLVLADEGAVRGASPEMRLVEQAGPRGVLIAAPARGSGHDVVCRFFAPGLGIPEDPVTGSACTELVPLWRGRGAGPRLRVLQASARAGEMIAEDRGPRVLIKGRAVKFLEGFIPWAAVPGGCRVGRGFDARR